jgi:nicotinate-nucleotide pyrophosphorylase (carboxylating)
MFIPRRILEEKLTKLLNEDIGQGDVTSSAIIPLKCKAEAKVEAKQSGIVAGVEEAEVLAESLGLNVATKIMDGQQVSKNQVIMFLNGDAATILAIERTLLNLLSRMSGIATATHRIIERITQAKLNTRISATRKSAPGLEFFDKKAVIIGGGDPHRLHLDDMILIKDNHIVVSGSLEEAVKSAKRNSSFSKKIEVEVTNPHDAVNAARLGVDIIMLDNFSPEDLRKTVKLLKGNSLPKVLLEASGGITSENILDFAFAGVDIISLGELTHSVKALDISLEITAATK